MPVTAHNTEIQIQFKTQGDNMIKKFEHGDLQHCAEILITVYNNELWQCRWSKEIAEKYLREIVDNKRFVGFTIWNEDKLNGAIFCHEKTWWNNDEIFIDEMFILPEFQRQGYGTELLNAVEEYISQNRLAGFTLTTNRYAPAPCFYRKNGFCDADHVLYMYKEV